MMFRSIHYLLVIMVAGGVGCGSEKETSSPDKAPEAAVPVVNDSRDDLVLSWFADGGSNVASSVGEVPAEARREVRVQDPTIPPEKRDVSVMFLADLRKPNPDGTYPVKTVKRAEWEAKRRAAQEAERKKAEAALAAQAQAKSQAAMPTLPSAMPPGAAPVVMYATKHCPVCIKARRWLLENQIPYVEHDIEKDMQAAQQLKAKGAAQGVPTNGVPMFEIGGRLIPGFDPATIVKMLSAMAKPTQSV